MLLKKKIISYTNFNKMAFVWFLKLGSRLICKRKNKVTRKNVTVSSTSFIIKPHFLFPFPMVSSSKFWSVVSREVLDGPARAKEEEDDGLAVGSGTSWVSWAVEEWPLFGTILLERFSVKSAEEVALTLETMAFLDELACLVEEIGFNQMHFFVRKDLKSI